MHTFREFWLHWRRKIKAAAPFVRRREYRIVERKYASLIQATNGLATPASSARFCIRNAVAEDLSGEICLFVSHAAQPTLKSHVVNHLNYLLDADIKVVLIINSDLAANEFRIDPDLEARLSGIMVRENIGFDFGAWAHAYSLLNRSRWARLFLINDSIVGPLDRDSFDKMLARIKNSSADFLGLTECLAPTRHLQSYFLVFNRTALLSPAFNRVMQGTLNFPDKGQVVDVYEINLTQRLRNEGLRAEALFPALSDDFHNSNDTSSRWDRLLNFGFPYIKTRIIQDFPSHPLVKIARAQGRVDSQI